MTKFGYTPWSISVDQSRHYFTSWWSSFVVNRHNIHSSYQMRTGFQQAWVTFTFRGHLRSSEVMWFNRPHRFPVCCNDVIMFHQFQKHIVVIVATNLEYFIAHRCLMSQMTATIQQFEMCLVLRKQERWCYQLPEKICLVSLTVLACDRQTESCDSIVCTIYKHRAAINDWLSTV